MHGILSKVVLEMFFEENSERLAFYRKRLIDFYLNDCKFRDYACEKLIYHYKQIGDTESLCAYLKTRETFFLMSSVKRGMILSQLRCKFVPVRDEKSKLRMCFQCQTKFGQLSYATISKNACYICGGALFNQTPNSAYFCISHSLSQSTAKLFCCCLCKQMKSTESSLETAPFYAGLCNFCYNQQICCKILTKSN